MLRPTSASGPEPISTQTAPSATSRRAGGNSAFDLHFNTKIDRMKLIDAKPVHDAFGITDPRLVAPGAPERSILFHRISLRGPGQMPPLATRIVDDRAAALLREWIQSLR